MLIQLFYTIYNSINCNENADIYFQSDINMLCTGCMLFFPNQKTIELTDHIFNERSTNSDNNDQIYLNHYLRSSPLNIKILDPNLFPNGLLFFSELSDNLYFRKFQEDFKNSKHPVMFVHANFMVGTDKKIVALKNKNLWFI
jgi:hypothetical protein